MACLSLPHPNSPPSHHARMGRCAPGARPQPHMLPARALWVDRPCVGPLQMFIACAAASLCSSKRCLLCCPQPWLAGWQPALPLHLPHGYPALPRPRPAALHASLVQPLMSVWI